MRHALDTIRLATTEIRARRTPRTLTLSTDFGFATYWLMPRLSQFKALMPDVDVKIITSQNVFDPSHDQADIAIAFGDPHADWGAHDVVKLFPERVTPVCSPAFLAAQCRMPRAPADLANLPLLHLEPTTPARWLSWADWFAAHGLDAPPAHRGITFNSYAFVAHAAIMGQGVALGWAPLVDELLATGQLVKLFDAPVVTERGYLLVTQRAATPAISAFRQWLLGECGLDAE